MKREAGQTLIEVLVAIAVMAIGGNAVITIALNSFGAIRLGNEQMQAAAYAAEGFEAVKSLRNGAWNALSIGTHGLSDSGGTWALSGSSDTSGQYTRTVAIAEVERDGSGNIVTSGGTNDPHTREVTTTVTWEIAPGRPGSITQTEYLTNWDSREHFEDTDAEFSDGTFSNTQVYTVEDPDGAVGLSPDTPTYWACVGVEGGLDLAGSVAAQDVFVSGSYAYVGSLTNSGGAEFFVIDISNTESPSLTGSLELGTDVNAVYAIGNYAYVATASNTSEFQVIDVTTPSTPTVVGTLNLTGTADAFDLVASGSRAYLTRDNDASGSEFFILNIGTPSTPSLVGSVDLGAASRGVQISGTYAFAVTDNTAQELRVIDMATEAAPVVVASVNLSGSVAANELDISGSYAYVVTANNAVGSEFYVVNITTPTSPSSSGSVNLGQGANIVEMDGTIAYLGASTAGQTFQIVDATTASSPSLSATLDVSDSAYNGLFWNGSRFFAATANTSLEFQVLRKDTTTNWRCAENKSTIDVSGSAAAQAVYVSGTTLYAVKTGAAGADFFIYDVTNAESPSLLGSLDLGANGNDVVVSGMYAYIATSSNSQELMVVDISTPSAPTLVGAFNATGTTDADAVNISGTKVLLAQGSTFYHIDVTTPTSPSLLGSFSLGGTGHRIEVLSSTYAYVATANTAAEVRVVDISAATPTSAGTYNAAGSAAARRLWIKGTELYMVSDANASGPEFHLLDISAPTSPTLTGSLEYGVATLGVAADNDESIAFAGPNTASRMLSIVDTTTPSSPDQIAFATTVGGQVNDMYFANDTVYLATALTTGEVMIYGKPTQGGGGGGGAFKTSGTYISSTLDSADTANWNVIEWSEYTTGCATGSIQLQIRTATTSGGLASGMWQGPDGEDADETDFFTDPNGEIIHGSHNGDRYAQYRITLSGDGTCTQQLTDIALNYTAY